MNITDSKCLRLMTIVNLKVTQHARLSSLEFPRYSKSIRNDTVLP